MVLSVYLQNFLLSSGRLVGSLGGLNKLLKKIDEVSK